MSDSRKTYLIELAVGLVLAISAAVLLGIFKVETLKDALRLLCDGFFFAASVYLVSGGLTFTSNGGALDGLFYTFKIGVARMRRDYESSRISFADYREERREKAKSPKIELLSGLTLLAVSVIILIAYSYV
jgi:hypothetical protein